MPNIVVILGVSRSGKDTLAQRLYISNSNARVVKFASPIKRAIALYLGVPVEYLEDGAFRNTIIPELGCTPLDLLVKSFDVMPEIHPQLGLYATERELRGTLGKGNDVIFTDCRNPVEAAYIRTLSWANPLTLIHINRDATPKPSDRYILEIKSTLLPICRIYHQYTNNSTLEALNSFGDSVVYSIPGWVK